MSANGNVLTPFEAVSLLRRRQGKRSLRQFAITLGVSAAYLSDVYKGHRAIGPKLQKAIKVRKVREIKVRYEVVR